MQLSCGYLGVEPAVFHKLRGGPNGHPQGTHRLATLNRQVSEAASGQAGESQQAPSLLSNSSSSRLTPGCSSRSFSTLRTAEMTVE